MMDQTTPTEEPQAFDRQTIDLINLVHSVNQFMSKKPSDTFEETQNESDAMVIENEKESLALDVTKLTLKEKRQALKLMKERQLLNEFELAKKNEIICEQRLKHANIELENIKLSLELEIEESDRLKQLKFKRSQKKKKPSYSSSSCSGSESVSSRSPSPENKRKRSPSPIRKPRSRSRSKSPIKKAPSPKRLSRSKSPVVTKSRSPMPRKNTELQEKEKPTNLSLSPRKRSLSPRKTNNTPRYENTRPKQQYENKRRRVGSPSSSFRSSGEYYTRSSSPQQQRNSRMRDSYEIQQYGRYSRIPEVPEIGYRAKDYSRYHERPRYAPIPSYNEQRYSNEPEMYDTYIPNDNNNSKPRINRNRLAGNREVKTGSLTYYTAFPSLFIRLDEKERQFIETVQMPERKSVSSSSRNTTSEPKSKEYTNNGSLPQIQMNIPADGAENGEITRTVKYTPVSTEKRYEEDEPCYDSD